MAPKPRAWLFLGDAQPIADKAIAQCVRDHGGKLAGLPSTSRITGKRKDGSSFPLTVVEVEDDADGWWDEYARVHGWLDVSKGGIERVYGEELKESS